ITQVEKKIKQCLMTELTMLKLQIVPAKCVRLRSFSRNIPLSYPLAGVIDVADSPTPRSYSPRDLWYARLGRRRRGGPRHGELHRDGDQPARPDRRLRRG